MLAQKLPLRPLSALHRRKYATIANDHWPQHPSFQRHPTPYQILNISPAETYAKSRFIELVKLYHPDFKHHHNNSSTSVSGTGGTAHVCSQLPESIRLERYRLIVAAHSLLSDPVKRAAYDTHGIGWLDGLEDSLILRSAATGGKAGRSAHGNATWEDWERWREQQEEEREREREAAGGGAAKQKPEPYYMRNGQFASLLIVFSIGAGAAQTMHAENLTEAKRLVREERHWVATQEYKRAQEIARKLGREQRIEEFVRQRDPAVLSQATLKELVMQPDICESGTADGRAKDLDMKRMFIKK